MVDLSSLDQAQLDLLKLELQIVAAKISDAVDTLWKIRNLSITLWTGTIAVGLGNFTQDKKPVLPLLILAAAIPICFVIGDVRNNRWYRRLADRERTIHKYLASDLSDDTFRSFDPSSVHRRQEDQQYRWETSFLRNLADPIPLSIYGGELLFGSIAFAVYLSHSWSIVLPVIAGLTILFLAGVNWVEQPWRLSHTGRQ